MKRKLLLLITFCFVFASFAFAQERQISGKIVSSSGSPVPFANVKIVGTSNGTVATLQGEFTLKVPAGAQLEVSSLGYETTTVSVGEQTQLTVTLKEEVKGLNTVVVTGLGVSRQQKALGYSMTEIDGDEIRNANVVDPVVALKGKVAGVFINTGTGGPTSSNRIQIRGVNTLDPNAQPLIVIDGVQVDDNPTGAGQWGSSQDFGNQMKNINSDDIASISVLKGAAATAAWGSKGLNGVILITTKRGRSDKKLGLNVTHTETWNQVYALPDFQNIWGEGVSDEFPTDPNTGKPQVDANWLGFNFGPKMKGQEVEDADGHLMKFLPFDQKEAYQTGRYMNTNVAIDGGNENTTFRFSYSHNVNKGIVANNKFTRNAFNLRATQKMGSLVDVDAGINFTQGDALNPMRDGGNDNPLFSLVYYAPVNYDYNYWIHHYVDSARGGLNPNEPYGIGSTFWGMYQNRAEQVDNNLLSHLKLSVHATPWLNLQLNGFANNTFSSYISKNAGTDANYGGGSYEQDQWKTNQYRLQGLLIAQKTYKDFETNLTIGAETFTRKYQRANAFTDGGLIIPRKYTLTNSVNPSKSSEAFSDYKLNSLYAFLDIGWKNQLYLSLTGRNDWSSALTYPDGHGRNSYFYPSASLSWVFSEGRTLPNWFTFGKIRASYAIVGKDANPYQNSGGLGYTLGTSYVDHLGNTVPIYNFQGGNSLGNLDLKPQRAHSIELGANLKFFDNRLGLDFTWYKTNTYNQILQLGMAQESGVSSQLINAGNVQNKGIEILLNATPVRTNDFQWDLSFNFTRNRNLIVELAPGVTEKDLEFGQGTDVKTVAYVGEQYGDIYTKYAFARYQALDDKGNPIDDPHNGMKVLRPASANGSAFGLYVRSQDYQNQGYVNIGHSQPKFYYGFNTGFTYKGFGLNIAIDGRVGGKIMSATYTYGFARGTWDNTLFGRDKEHGGLERKTYDANGNVTGTFYDGIIPDGVFEQGSTIKDPQGVTHDIGGMTYQEAVDKGWMEPEAASNYYIWLGTWGNGIRELQAGELNWMMLRDVTISYDLPASWARKIKMSTARISISGRNLMYLLNSMPAHINPDGIYNSNAATAFEYGGLPYVRNVGFKIQLGF